MVMCALTLVIYVRPIFWTYVTYGQSTENRTIMINGGLPRSPKYALDWLSVDWNISIRYGAKVP